jgi:hypothetical protein
MHKRLGLTAIAALALAASMAAQADTQPGFYCRRGLGTTKIGDDASTARIDDSDYGLQDLRRLRFNENSRVEVSYFDLGEASASAGRRQRRRRLSALSARRRPAADQRHVRVFGKLGYASYDIDAHVELAGVGSGTRATASPT